MFYVKKCLALVLVVTASAFNSVAAADGPAKEVPLDASLNEHIVMIKGSDFFKSEIQTTIFKPPGDGPFPLVVFNHGHDKGSLRYGHLQQRERAIFFTREMLKRGYMVACPMRKGYADSGGGSVRDFRDQYEDVVTAIKYLTQLDYVDSRSILLAGHSLGGYVSMSLAKRRDLFPNLKGIVSFAGGLPADYSRKYEDELTLFSSTGNVPAIWFYASNDFLTSSEKLEKMEISYKRENPDLTIIRINEHNLSDGHYIPYSPDILKDWIKPLEQFLRNNGLPSDEKFEYEFRATAKIGIRFLEDDLADTAIEILKTHSLNQWNGYQKYKALTASPKAFAVSTVNNRWAYASGYDLADEIAIKQCEKAGVKCRLFAANDKIVE